MTNLKAVMEKTDWPLLAKQKQQVLIERILPDLGESEDEAMDGLLNWIDAIQDAAELDGFPVVFLKEKP